ncbi:DUF2530 domain-containing protein [Actinosynnema sp. NPDC020468]|uniref:DUF2530 domain-containing protein n=1 Tax=Actinosynnema sp. NPDC020468 TaxID=3154488 RepID=UPI003402A58C
MPEQPHLPPPPPLPKTLTDPVPAIVGGTALWFAAFLVVLVFARDDTTLLFTTLAGGLLGLIGYSIFRWQQAASRRGSKTAQQGLTD